MSDDFNPPPANGIMVTKNLPQIGDDLAASAALLLAKSNYDSLVGANGVSLFAPWSDHEASLAALQAWQVAADCAASARRAARSADPSPAPGPLTYPTVPEGLSPTPQSLAREAERADRWEAGQSPAYAEHVYRCQRFIAARCFGRAQPSPEADARLGAAIAALTEEDLAWVRRVCAIDAI